MSFRIGAAPQWQISHWLNTPEPIDLGNLVGQVVAIFAFQMLCPACVAHSLPQASKLRQSFFPSELAIIGLHTVFEHHAVMRPEALEAFIHEYRLPFPVAVDAASANSPLPQTMAAWGLQGTPSLILLGRDGLLDSCHFGAISDLALGAHIGRLLAQPRP